MTADLRAPRDDIVAVTRSPLLDDGAERAW
jgi:hypothetical protein